MSTLQKAVCEQSRTLANNRIRAAIAQRELADRQRQENERTCRIEQKALVEIWDNLAAIEVFVPQAKCEQVKATASERLKIGAAQREEAEVQQKAARNCQTEQATAQSVWNDIGKLREFARRSTCEEMRQTLSARIDALQTEERQQRLAEREAATKLAALEAERAKQRRQEEDQRQAEQARQQAEARCKSELVEFGSIETDVSRLRQFAKRSGCEDVRKLTNEKIASIEREEKTCRDEDGRRVSLLDQVRTQNERTRLAKSKDEMFKLQVEITCARLRPSFVDAIGTIRVKLAQVELKRLGCFSGASDGLLSDATRDAAKLFLASIGNPDRDVEINDGLLSDLNSHVDPVCKPAGPPVIGTEPGPERVTPRTKQASRPPVQRGKARPAEKEREAPARATSRAEAAPREAAPRLRPPPVQASPRASAGPSGAGMIIIGH